MERQEILFRGSLAIIDLCPGKLGKSIGLHKFVGKPETLHFEWMFLSITKAAEIGRINQGSFFVHSHNYYNNLNSRVLETSTV
jgi:hypothetical protein